MRAPQADLTDSPGSEVPTAGPETPLLPPRPNLGPEPWPEPSWVGPATMAIATLAATLVLGVIVARLRSHRRGRRASPPGARASTTLNRASDAGLSAADRLLLRAEAVREALVLAFGPSWAARTTEEIAAAPELIDRLDPDRAARTVALLAEADRAKFAGLDVGDDPGNGEGDWVSEVVADLTAGASSGRTGK